MLVCFVVHDNKDALVWTCGLTNVDPLIPAAARESIAEGVTCVKSDAS